MPSILTNKIISVKLVGTKRCLILILCFFSFFPFFVLAQEMVDINTASLEELQTITGIGPAYAQKIIDNRPFSSIDDLTRISGIGEKTLQKIKEQGLAYVNVGVGLPDPKTKIDETDKVGEELLPSQPKSAEARPPQIKYPGNIVFSRIMPSPVGLDAENEWIEIKNNNDFEVDLTGWIIKDKRGSIKEYVLGQKIDPLKILKITRPESKITLNNSGDGLELLNPNREIIDFVDFGKAQTGVAYIKTASGWQWDASKEPKPEVARLPDKQEPRILEETIIDLSQENKKSGLSLILTGLLFAFLSATVFIIFKRMLIEY